MIAERSSNTVVAGVSPAQPARLPLQDLASQSLTEFQAKEMQRRQQLVLQLQHLTTRAKKPLSQNAAAKLLGESPVTMSRWRRAFENGGIDALKPKQADACGRSPKFELDENESNALRHCHLRKDSLPLAIEDFINEPECRPETRAKILAEMDRAARERKLPHWPMSIQRAAYVSDDTRAEFRGRKHAQQFEIVERRGLWWIDENGHELPIVGNTLFESDDQSANEPFRYADPETGAIQVGRQTLCTMNVYSAAWLAISPVGRERDAYRLEDIADHLRETVGAHGLPLIWRFERGPWENQVIDGLKLKDGTKWGSLENLFRVVHVFKSRSKGLIETSFDLLQSLCAHESLSIGRSRGEFERATKLFMAAGRGDHAAAAHFWEIGAAADGFAGAMERFNNRPKIRRAFGRQAVVPNDLQRSAEKRECPPNELWRFSPIKREATVRGGAIEVSVPHYPFPFRFRVNGLSDLYLEHGYGVLIAFHPGRPEEGCHVFNAERGVRNRDGLKFAEPMFVAPMAEDAPQLNLRPDEYEFVRRKNSNAAVRSEFRAIVATGARGPRTSTARDGYGNSKTLQAAGCGARANPDDRVFPVGGKQPGRVIPRDESPAPAKKSAVAAGVSPATTTARPTRPPLQDFDEEAELNRIARLENDAIARGDILVT